MAGKELSKLVAFVKGTQFDLVVRRSCWLTCSNPLKIIFLHFEVCKSFNDNQSQEYLQRERYGSARLENFASGLELISQKVWDFNILKSKLIFWLFLFPVLHFIGLKFHRPNNILLSLYFLSILFTEVLILCSVVILSYL